MNFAQRRTMRKGTAYVLAIILLALSMAVAVAFATFADVNARTGRNMADIHRARLAAESGMAFAVGRVQMIPLPYATDDANVIANIAAALGDRLNGTGNLAGDTVTHDADTVFVPRIETDDGAFEIYVVQQPDGTLTLEVHGFADGVRRVGAVDLTVKSDHPNSVFNYGLASRGAISIDGNGQIRGMSELTEASVISSSEGGTAITIGGNAIVDGDISSVGLDTSVVISGTPTIAGSQDPEVMAEHIHFGVEPPAFPEIDTSIFRPLATGDVIDSGTDTSVSGAVFENVIIKAGANPTFASDVTVNGVVFIEAPNIVTFSGKVTLNAMIATEPSDSPIESCKLSFAGQVDSFGIESLSGTQFDAVKELTGTFIVAPGFDVSFAGQFSTISGTIAADKMTFSGQSSGTIHGSLIGLADYPSSISGTVDIVVDTSGEDTPDAGLLPAKALDVDPRTYREVSLVAGS